jgi:hypothetical protein
VLVCVLVKLSGEYEVTHIREKLFASWAGLGDPVSDGPKDMVTLTSPKDREQNAGMTSG